MQLEIRVPPMGESITEATVANWLKQPGDAVAEGEVLVELETDKVMVEVPASQAGVLTEVLRAAGETVKLGDLLGRIDTDGTGAAKPAASPAARPPAPSAGPKPAPAVSTAPAAARNETLGPAARRLVEEHQLDAAAIPGTGRRGQVTKENVVQFLERAAQPAAAAPAPQPVPAAPAAPRPTPAAARPPGEREERVKMSRLRQRIAERLLQAQQNAAILTTFNEVDMGAVMELRNRYKEAFRAKYGLAIGFMSFFTKACVAALKAFPSVNGEIAGDEIVYKRYYDIGVAVGTERGLVVPVVRDADQKSFIDIELEIADLAKRAREGKLALDDLTGGTFTITNGGIYGSMMSTPILNPPQSGILGMHNIVKRAMVVNDQVAVRPMMYAALSYDHRIVDGREAVQFLVRVKECIEDPARLLLDI
jgi:2-oxoglutarate dehydrogenase E2 component (dihydrolipoamide succinyltransferase)